MLKEKRKQKYRNHSNGDMGHEDIEIKLLLEAIFLKYGYDFRNYANESIKRRIFQRLMLSKLASISAMQHQLLTNKPFFETLLLDFSINVTEMYRDPSFYRALRKNVIPILKTFLPNEPILDITYI